MDRSKRICLVTAIGICLASLLMAFVGAPLMASFFFPSLEFTGNIRGDIHQYTSSLDHAMGIASLVWFVSLAVAGTSFLYVLITLAAWFIGPRDKPREPAA